MAVLPRALKYLSTLTSELNWSEECIRIIDASERKPLFGEITKERKRNDTSKRQEKKSLTYPKEQRESLIRTEIRFSQFAKSFEYLKQFDIRFGESLKEYRKSNRREQLNLLTQSAIERKKEIRKPENKRSKLIEIDRLRLHQCVFCWRYRLNSSLEMQVSTEDESKWHCERSECAKAFGSWRKDLNSKDISLKDIGRREGF